MTTAASFKVSSRFAVDAPRQAETQNAIQIHLGAQGWLATFSGPHSKKIIDLFDSATLPLPYTAAMPLGTVIAEVQQRNPGVSVFHFSKVVRS